MITHIPISSNTSGNSVVLTGQSKPVTVLAYTLIVAGAVNLKFTDGTSDQTGLMPFSANGGISAPHCPAGHFRVEEGKSIILNLSDAIQVSGHMTVEISDIQRV